MTSYPLGPTSNGVGVGVVSTPSKTGSAQLLNYHLIFQGFQFPHLIFGKFGHNIKVILNVMQRMNSVSAKNDSINYQGVLVELSIISGFRLLAGGKCLEFGFTHVLIRNDVCTHNILYIKLGQKVLTFQVLLMHKTVELLD